MSRPTIANLKLENALLRERISQYGRLVDIAKAENGKLKTEIHDGLNRESAFRDLATVERKEVMWFRANMKETLKEMDRLRDRIDVTIDCVDRPPGCHELMSQKLHLYVGTIIDHAIRNPVCNISNLVNLKNFEAHKIVRAESDLKPINPGDI